MERLIHGSARLHAPAARAMRGLRDRDCVVLGAPTLATARRPELGLGPLHQKLAMELGAPEDEGNRISRPIAWKAAAHPDVFPAFEGEIAVELDEQGAAVLCLRGRYTVPLGAVGRFGDGLVGRRVALRCIAGLIDDVARHLDHAAEPLAEHDDPARYDVEVVDRSAAEA